MHRIDSRYPWYRMPPPCPQPSARIRVIAPAPVGAFPDRLACARIGWRYSSRTRTALPPARAGRPSRDHAHDPDIPAPAEKRTSGNPATQAEINLTVKQQREQKRQEKLAEYQKQLAKRRRSKLVWWMVGSLGRRRRHRADRRIHRLRSHAGADATPRAATAPTIEGVETFENTDRTTSRALSTTRSRPPAGGAAQRGLAQLRHLRPARAERERRPLARARRGLGHLRRVAVDGRRARRP